jgi:hypothetical protein
MIIELGSVTEMTQNTTILGGPDNQGYVLHF